MKYFQILATTLLSTVLLTSCSDDFTEVTTEPVEIEVSNDITGAEEAFPGQTGRIESMYDGLNQIKLTSINDTYVFEGDILFKKDQLKHDLGDSQQRSTGRTSGRWANNTVYYAIDPALPNQTRVYDAIANWEANTSVRFVQRTSENDYVYFTPGGGCSSYVGRIGGRQEISLASGCTTGSTIHEIGHAVGLWHEQSRVDRDEYITINFDNIQAGVEYNFLTYVAQGQDGTEFTDALDFNSVMLYSSYAFSGNGQPTITKLDGSTYSTNRSGLSSGDIAGINQMYPGDGGNGGDGGSSDVCDGIAAYNGSISYNIGDRVTYQGGAYERVSGGWNYLGECTVTEPADICEGVAPYQGGVSYSVGDLVTYQGYLYERRTYNWSRIGQCG
ncbi:M12 family metallopeptidase [Dokdonia sp. Hel_I_53]|uniref:M12 family metallopeptidase n=1 Tax=Dokdonia sp. Hel_I_53 TaxID=1566287 RepID=UPI001199314B|nr:M12 family metallopeptidase [Dokdonia sp. Hel_I_53]TVZ52119.1 astacin (peptidase family M12A) [Dokdonia sp. Hel_I_53]